MAIRVGVLTVSDLASQGRRADDSGDAVAAWVAGRGFELVVRSVVPDETDRIAAKLARWSDSGAVDLVLTTGGPGLGERDGTPAATLKVATSREPASANADYAPS